MLLYTCELCNVYLLQIQIVQQKIIRESILKVFLKVLYYVTVSVLDIPYFFIIQDGSNAINKVYSTCVCEWGH